MSTRAQVRFATREDGVSFSEHPEKIHAQFYVHSDGYPEHLGIEIAESIIQSGKINNMRRLIYDMYYADEISVEIAERLLNRLENSKNKSRRY